MKEIQRHLDDKLEYDSEDDYADEQLDLLNTIKLPMNL